MIKQQATGLFSKKEAHAFTIDFQEIISKRFGVQARATFTSVGDKSADEWRIEIESVCEIMPLLLEFYQVGYDSACAFRQVT